MPDTLTASLVLSVVYRQNGVPEAALRDLLSRVVDRAIGEGGLTGDTEAEVETWDACVHITAGEVSHA